MRIPAISGANFTGLWGKEKSDCLSSSFYDHAQMCEMGTNHQVTTKIYYPFKNETPEHIKNVVKENSKIESYTNHFDNDISDNINEISVKVMPKLDITENEYNKYKNDDLLSKEENRVEDILKMSGLKEYLIRNMRRRY